MKDRFQNTLGGDAVGNTPEQFAANIRDDIERWGKIVKQTGIKLE
jgi:tripartite-type tricarboxylate transporter receptor subunit TctC